MIIKANFDNPVVTAPISKNRENIDASGLKLSANPIDAKRMSARKQAMKLVSDAWERDNKAYVGIHDMENGKAIKAEEYRDLKNKINDIESQKEMWREEYGVEADSNEQKDLELLQKYQDNKNGASYDEFSDEEIARLKELQTTPLTDYQKKVLELNDVKDFVKKELQIKENELIALTGEVTNATLDMEKNQDMLKSKDAADSLLEAASKDIVGMLVDEAKEHVEEKAEEVEEKAEKLKAQKEERAERLEESKERRDEQERIIHNQIEADKIEMDSAVKEQTVDHLAEAQRAIEKVMNNNHMVNEDLKGIEIDLKF